MFTTTALPPQTIDDLRAGYAFRRPDEIADFLETHPFLVPLLLEARPVIARHFGAETPVVLEVSYDPEDNDLTQLVGFIETDLEPEAALARESRFWDDWWLANVNRGQWRLAFGPWYRTRSKP